MSLGWTIFFKSTWGQFDTRFNFILDSLSRHSDLVDREANAFSIAETMKWREEALQEASLKEKQRLTAQLTAAMDWLNPDKLTCRRYQQEDILDKLISDCCPGTTEWILRHPKMKTWLKHGPGQATLWLTGKPGSGTCPCNFSESG